MYISDLAAAAAAAMTGGASTLGAAASMATGAGGLGGSATGSCSSEKGCTDQENINRLFENITQTGKMSQNLQKCFV